MDTVIDMILRLAPPILYVIISLQYHKRDKRQRAVIEELNGQLNEKVQTIVDVCTERDAAAELANSMMVYLEENEKIVTAEDVRIAAQQTRQWIPE